MRLHLHYSPKKQGGSIYTYFSVARSYRDKEGTPRKEILVPLGKLSPQEEQSWRLRLSFFNGDPEDVCNLKQLQFTSSRRYLDVALLSQLYDGLEIGRAFEHVSEKEVGTAAVAKILVLSRMLDPQAMYKTVDWLEDSYLPEIMGINTTKYNKDKIFRELENISLKRHALQERLLRRSRQMNPEELELYFFDGTTSFFEGTHCELAQPGTDKQVGYNENVILICLATDRRGFPVAWDTFAGNKRDITEFKKIANTMCEQLEMKDVTFCFDRGVASESNFTLIEDVCGLNSKYITGLDRNQIEGIFDLDDFIKNKRSTLIQKHAEESAPVRGDNSKRVRILPTLGFYRLGHDRFYKDLGIIDGRRYLVSFNVNICKQEQMMRISRIERVKTQLDRLNIELSTAKSERSDVALEKKIEKIIQKNWLTKIIEYNIIPTVSPNGTQTYSIRYTINNLEVQHQEKHDGILVFVTNHTEKQNNHFIVSPGSIVEHYKNKYVVENAFRYLKSFADLRPFYVRLDEHVKAHVDICMIAYFIDTLLYHQLKNQDLSLEDFYDLLKNYARVCELTPATGKSITLLKKIPERLTELFKNLKVQSICETEVLEKFKIRQSE